MIDPPLPLCMARYERSKVVKGAVDLVCQLPKRHNDDRLVQVREVHSWSEIARLDERESGVQLEDVRMPSGPLHAATSTEHVTRPKHDRVTPPLVVEIVEALQDGQLDEHIEEILSAAHDRKRMRRGTKGRWRRPRED